MFLYGQATVNGFCMCMDACVGIFLRLSAFCPITNNNHQTVRCIYNLHHKLQKAGLLYLCWSAVAMAMAAMAMSMITIA